MENLTERGIGTTNLGITLPFTLDVFVPASRADRLFLIVFEVQWRERASRDEDSRGARTLTEDLNSEGYIYERRSSLIVARLIALKTKKRGIIEAEERYVSRIPLVKMEFKHSIE